MMQRGLHILVLISMLPGMLAGLGADRVFCVGADGQMAIESAMLCSQGTCMSMAIDAPLDGQPLQQLAFTSSMNCGPCTDVPGVTSLVSIGRGHNSSAQPLTQPVPVVTMPDFAVAELAVANAPIRPADTPADRCASLRSAVLLI